MKSTLTLLTALLLAPLAALHAAETAAERDARMAWWREARFGMFVHWGLYSGLAGTWDGKPVAKTGGMEWIQNLVKADTDAYAKAALPKFQPTPGFAREWAKLAKEAGCKYLVFTTKHHEGFGLYASKFGDYNAGAKLDRDLVKEIVEACHAEGLRVGFYHSVIDWHHDQYAYQKSKQLPHPLGGQPYPNGQRDHAKYIQYLHDQVNELMSNYGKVDVLWWDYSAQDFQGDAAWRATELMNAVRAKQPAIIMNNRLFRSPEAGWGGMGTGGYTSHMDPKYGDFITPEQEIPAAGMSGMDWESCMTLNTTWGFSEHDHAWKTDSALIRNLVDAASKGGNFLLNIGPKGDGSLTPETMKSFQAIGAWMKVNGESIYGTSASPFAKLDWGRATQKGHVVYLHVFDWPKDGKLMVPLKSKVKEARLLAGGETLRVESKGDNQLIHLPTAAPDAVASVIRVELDGPLDVDTVLLLAAGSVGSITAQPPKTNTNGVAPKGGLHAADVLSKTSKLPLTGVTFHTKDADLQLLYDAAEARAAENIAQFTPNMKILPEGPGSGAWLEVQPMCGEMYAKRNLEVALNNQLIFMRAQRADGRLPGLVTSGISARKSGSDKKPLEGEVWMPEQDLLANFMMLQGYWFPDPAWRMYFWAGKDREYLRMLYAAMEAYDAYLWRTRDSNGDGLLETWCIWDTGEDHSTRLLTRNAPTRWLFEFAPGDARMPDPRDSANFKYYWFEHFLEKLPMPTRDQVLMPFASMEMMAYSYEGRATLAKIARELGNGREAYWQEQAGEVRQRLIQGLWDPVRSACFDRDRNGKRLDELIHNNLRCMWFGIFSQEMADAFIGRHLLNPAEFWTPVPFPPIAINEKLYRNVDGNDFTSGAWGLTFQRAIRALENYGHYAEVSLVGQKLLPVLIRNGCKFSMKFDNLTGKPSGWGNGCISSTILSALEYISRMFGLHLDVANNQVWWSALEGADFTYTQRWGEREWTLTATKERFTGSLNGKEVFSCTRGVRVVTDLDGKVREVVGIAPGQQTIDLQIAGTRHAPTVKPNQVWGLYGTKPVLLRAAPFDYPYQGKTR